MDSESTMTPSKSNRIAFRLAAVTVGSVSVGSSLRLFALRQAGDGDHLLALLEPDQTHALGVAAALAYLGHPEADDLAARRDQHHLVLAGRHQNAPHHA